MLWLLKLGMARRFDRHFTMAMALFVASGLISSYVSMTSWWFQLAHLITR